MDPSGVLLVVVAVKSVASYNIGNVSENIGGVAVKFGTCVFSRGGCDDMLCAEYYKKKEKFF